MKRAFLAAIIAGGLCAAQTPAPVKVEGGLIQGTGEEGLTVYRGIRFATPPVGDLRWRAPQPAAKWDGVRQAAKFGPRCMQGTANPGAANPGPGTSEDCLYLNVWTPAKSAGDRVPASPVQSTTTLARIDLRPRFVLTNRHCDAISLSYRIGCAEVDQVVRAEKALICSLNKE